MGYRDVAYPPIGVDPPLAAAAAVTDLEEDFLISRLELFDFSRMTNRYRNAGLDELADSEADVVCNGTLTNPFMICAYLRGMERFLEDMAWGGPLLDLLVAQVGEYCVELERRHLAATAGKAAYYGTWGDVAGQNAMLFSPELFRKHFLPSMIDAGIDVFDVVQTSARGRTPGGSQSPGTVGNPRGLHPGPLPRSPP